MLVGILVDNVIEQLPVLALGTIRKFPPPPPRIGIGRMVEDSYKTNISRFLLKVARLLEPSGCRTVRELMATDILAKDDLTDDAKLLLSSLATLDYVALRSLASVLEYPVAVMDDDSYLGPELPPQP